MVNDSDTPWWLVYVVYGVFIIVMLIFLLCQWGMKQIAWSGFLTVMVMTLILLVVGAIMGTDYAAFTPLLATLSAIFVVYIYQRVKNWLLGLVRYCLGFGPAGNGETRAPT